MEILIDQNAHTHPPTGRWVGLAHARHKSQHLHLNLQHVEGAQGNEHSRTAEQAAVHAGVARSYKAGRPRAFRPPPQGAGRARGGSH